ncbi:MAG: hypothetical protein V3U57_01210 [Robiginitomaculum sp.]
MRLSYLTATRLTTGLAIGFVAISTPAFAACGSNKMTCNSSVSKYESSHHRQLNHMGSHHMVDGAQSHNYSHNYSSSSANNPCPSGSTRGKGGLCMVDGSSSYTASTYNHAPRGSYSSHRLSTSSSNADYGHGSISRAYTNGNTTVIPLSTSSLSSLTAKNMDTGDSLVPTHCPVSVNAPTGSRVLGCYAVSRPAPAPVVIPAPIVIPQYNIVRVVRPVIYVRYPVPTPVMMPSCGVVTNYSRYGGACP